MKGVVLVGILLMVLSFVLLCGMVVIPSLTPSLDSLPLVRDALNALLCEPEEHIVGEQSVTSSQPGRTNFTMYVSCVDSAGRERSVQDPYMLYMVASFIVPFLLGLFMTMFGAARGAASKVSAPGGSGSPSLFGGASNPMTVRLRDLKTAYDSGLITAAEYDAKRRDILDQG
jgi:hypothetical protein